MAKTTVIDTQSLEQRMTKYYDNVMDQVYLMYHVHPTNLPHFDGDLGPGEEYRGYANQAGSNGSKKVHLYTPQGMSNGLPSRKR